VKLLFLCTHNTCRSIIGEAVARQLGGDRLQAKSAGSHPSGVVHPLTLRYLEEAGYSLDGLVSQGLDDVADFAPDAVITVCDAAAQEPCPLWLETTVKAHWGFADPSRLQGSDAEQAEAYASLIGKLERRIETLLEHAFEDLGPGALANLMNDIAKDQ